MIWHGVFDIYEPAPEPYMVVRVDSDKHSEKGVQGVIVSLHMDRAEAQKIADGLNISAWNVSHDADTARRN